MKTLSRVPARSSAWMLSGLGVMCMAVGGCGGDGPKTYPVKITVLDQKGQPVPGAQVLLSSENADGPRARGIADQQGVATVKTEDTSEDALLTDGFAGAVAGTHRVSVLSPMQTGDPDSPPTGPRVLPKFAGFDTSGLTVAVEPGGKNSFEVKVSTR